jgi:hypothetical protein
MPAKLNIGINQIVELILQLPNEEEKALFVELKKFSEFKFLLNEFLQIGENLNITNDEITAEVESFRKEQFA